MPQALARLTPKRSAAWRQVAPAATADATRWRRSTDKGVGIGLLLAPSTPNQSAQLQIGRDAL